MTKLEVTLKDIQKIYNIKSSNHRSALLASMNKLEQGGTDCSKCIGFCCTYYHNSMQITPLEAIEILIDLMDKNKINQDLIRHLNDNIIKYRLNHEVSDGKGRILRRYYTCPFFKHESLGCSISPESKPYGCLAFNPTEENVQVEGKCRTNRELLESREIIFEEEENRINEELRTSFKLYWAKKPIPSALVEIINKMLVD